MLNVKDHCFEWAKSALLVIGGEQEGLPSSVIEGLRRQQAAVRRYATFRLATSARSKYTSFMPVRLIQCDQLGEPVEDAGILPPMLRDNCRATAELFASIGFSPPWVGYVTVDGCQPVGGCAFVGAPKDSSVEIAYFTLEMFEGRGYARQAVERMIKVAWQSAPTVSLTAKTAPIENASTAILRSNGFRFSGETHDDGIGLAWAWMLRPRLKSD